MDFLRYTDKYFIRTRQVLEAEDINPVISMSVFARGRGKIAGTDEAASFIRQHSDAELSATKGNYEDMEPFMQIRGRVQDIIELETVYLGILSNAMSEANGFKKPEPEEIKNHFQGLKKIYRAIPITYFGARHYHYSDDSWIAEAALRGGAVDTSTDQGSSGIGKKGVGTMPHILPLICAWKYGPGNATAMAARLFDRHIEQKVPRVVLVDTFNREITDSLAVARLFPDAMLRIDTCSESVGENCTAEKNGCITGPGVTVELVQKVRAALDHEGLENSIFLSGGFGNPEKARAFMEANDEYKARAGRNLFEGVGIGEFAPGVFCTADMVEVEGHKMAKSGRQR